MRTVAAGLFITLDGVTEAPERWQGAYMDDEVGQVIGAGVASADPLLLGRRTYEEWAAFWPAQGAGTPIAAFLNGVPKLVASTTLERADWAGSIVVRDVPAALAEATAGDGGDILVNGSATLVRSLLAGDLLDRLSLLLHPVVAGAGRRLFDGAAPARLELAESRTLASGVVHLSYRRPGA